jgi:hypothetical protein
MAPSALITTNRHPRTTRQLHRASDASVARLRDGSTGRILVFGHGVCTLHRWRQLRTWVPQYPGCQKRTLVFETTSLRIPLVVLPDDQMNSEAMVVTRYAMCLAFHSAAAQVCRTARLPISSRANRGH